MINAKCFTKQEKYKNVKFPNKFVAVPSIGDRVRVLGESNDYLKVVTITHVQDDPNGDPSIVIELDYAPIYKYGQVESR